MPMNPSEMLRRLADIIDGMSNQQSPGGSDTVINQPKANMQPVEVDATDHSDSSTMVSPLQQGFEMMKIATGGAEGGEEHVEGEICEHCGKGICECDDTPMEGGDDEVAIMRRNAGMQAKRDNAEGAESASDAAHEEPPKPDLNDDVNEDLDRFRRIAGLR